MFFLGAISEPLLYCLIGPKWHEAAVYLPLICITGSTYPLHAINLNMLQVQGRSDLFLGLEVIKKIIGIAPLSVCIFYGILPMLYTSILINIISYFLNSYYSGKFLGYSSWMQIRDIAPSYGLATLVALSVFFLKYLPISYWAILPLQIVIGGTLFFAICRLARIQEYIELKSIVLNIIRKK
jgi:O-antigen/teichoic acid export membrane protein